MNKKSILKKLSKYFDKSFLDQVDFKNINGDKDIISSIYEQINKKDSRKKYSQFFTHEELVDFIFSNIPVSKKSTILDPACGAGAFLIKAIDKVGLGNAYGIDIDQKALDLCSINIEYKCESKSKNLVRTNTLSSEMSLLFPKIKDQGGFDIVVGNPPFQNLILNKDYLANDPTYKDFISGIANSATLMLAKGYEYLKQGGYLGFVLPKNILRVDSFKKLRDFLLYRTRIHSIYDLDHYFKDVRGDQIILIIQKTTIDTNQILKNQVKINIFKNGQSFQRPYTYTIPQKLLGDYSFFPVFYHKNIFPLAKKLLKKNQVTLDSLCEGQIYRGLGLSTSSNFLSKNEKTNYLKVYRGDSIKRFGIKYALFLDKTKLTTFSPTRVQRLQKDKIIIQNLCSKEGGIFASLSSYKELTLDTVTNIIPTSLNQKYILGLLNSNIANFFLIFIIFLNSNFTMHSDRQYIGKLPVVIPNKKQEKEVVDTVNSLIKLDDKYSKQFLSLYEGLNDTLYKIYKFSKSEVGIIEKLLREVMSKKHYGTTNE